MENLIKISSNHILLLFGYFISEETIAVNLLDVGIQYLDVNSSAFFIKKRKCLVESDGATHLAMKEALENADKM